MKKIIILALMLMTSVLINGVSAKAQTPRQIQFAKGRTSIVVKGTTGSSGITYLIRARSGQKLILGLKPSSGIGIKVTGSGSDGEMVLLREEKGGTYEIGLEESGDYTIFIGSINHQPIVFTLTVKIAKLADI